MGRLKNAGTRHAGLGPDPALELLLDNGRHGRCCSEGLIDSVLLTAL